ncbi:helix-turn-helix domain-containing protein [Ectobacillus sp. JY-23]|uniref:helix-turn-helix domain-containing protein n=1 Tax=Ectobacillus sp. JY-23 TaxID=2933872 RepID=UPI001FF44F58|nr:helix-turn-helix domain-containing protein [Ectobacillus sp. JY-23]UOY93503.1 helix-turn-helix domain-containing protein [Ectobacillus sp. JY-23]
MTFLHVVLYGIKQMNGERSAASIYHLLKGKRSSQTLQDASIYQLSFLFGIYRRLERHTYNEHIKQMIQHDFLREIEEARYILTEKGEQELQDFKFPIHLHGLKYGEAGEVFWKRLSLLIQTVSYLQHRVPFLPIQAEHEVTAWTKQFLLKQACSRDEFRYKLHTECELLLKNLTAEEATVVVYRLSGFSRVGYTHLQIAQMLGMDPSAVHLSFLGAIHGIVRFLMKEGTGYPILSQLLPRTRHVLSLSTQKTYELWKQGKTMEQIANIRSLKLNTIEDHIVEIATHLPHFPIHTFLSEETIINVQKALQQTDSRTLRILKQYLPHVSYFHIRLVMACLGGKHES